MLTITDENVNGIVDYSVGMVDSIIKDKKYSGRLKNSLYLTFISYLIEYGYEEIENIYKTFSSIKFTTTNLSIGDYFNSRSDLSSKKYGLTDKMATGSPAITVSSLGGSWSRPEFYDEIIISNSMDLDPILWLESIIHEINHLFVSQKNRIFLDGEHLYARMGLCVTEIYNSGKVEKGRLFNECINSLQTESLVQNIIDLYGLKINNPFVAGALENIKFMAGKKYVSLGYRDLLPLYRPLYGNKRFNNSLNDGLISGNIKSIETHFDRCTDQGSYDKMLDCSDKIFSFIICDQPNIMISSLVNEMNGIISQYKVNTDSKKY